MARSQDDDLLIGDELAAAFLEGDDSLAPAAPTHQPMNHAQANPMPAQSQRQARQAFACPRTLSSEVTYCLIDDISTTGATIRYAARHLRTAGARQVIAVVVAHQPFG